MSPQERDQGFYNQLASNSLAPGKKLLSCLAYSQVQLNLACYMQWT